MTERGRGWALRASIVSLGVGVGTQVLANLIIVPVLFRHLGEEGFGLWAVTASVMLLLAPLDLGIGNSLVQRVTQARALEDVNGALRAVRAAALLSLLLGVVVFGAAHVVAGAVRWTSAFDAAGAVSEGELSQTIRVVGAAFALGLLGSLAERLHVAVQMAHRNGIVMTISSGLIVFAVVLVSAAGGGLAALAAVTMMTLPVVRLVAVAVLAARDEPWLRQIVGRVTRSDLRALAGVSSAYAVLQIAAAVAYNSDQVVIARVLGADAVPQYAIPAKLFALLAAGVNIVCTPLWPALTDAQMQGDWTWFVRSVRRALGGLVAAAVVFGLTLAIAGPWLLREWIGEGYDPDRSTLVAFGVWALIYSGASVITVILQSLDALRSLMVVAVSTAVLSVTLSILLVRLLGPAGAVWGSAIAYAIVLTMSAPLLRREYQLRRASGPRSIGLTAVVPGVGGAPT